MKLPLLITAAALLAVGAYALTSTTVQEKKAQEAGSPGADQMPEWMIPGANHEILAKRAGEWNFKLIGHDPNMPMETTGTSTQKMIFDGRFLEDMTQCSLMGMPFEGRGYTGYDGLKKKFVGVWMDNMGTSVMTMDGTYDAATKTLTYMSEMPDHSGEFVKTRIVETMPDDDHYTSKFYKTGPDGKETLSMTIECSRAK